MKPEKFLPFLQKFVTVRLDDGTVDSGYISNPEQFTNNPSDDMDIILVNGLLNSKIPIKRIFSIEEAVSEDTLQIPIVGFDAPLTPVEMEEKLDELYEKSMIEELDLQFDENEEENKEDDKKEEE